MDDVVQMAYAMVATEKSVIARNIKRFREEAGLSQDGLADVLGMPKNTLARYEQEARKVDIYALGRIATAIGRPVDDFYKEDPPARKRTTEEPAFSLKTRRKDVPDDIRERAEAYFRQLNTEAAHRIHDLKKSKPRK